MSRTKDPVDLPFRIVKMIDIGYLTTIYFLLGFGLSLLIDYILDGSAIESKSVFRIAIEVIGLLWLNGCVIYIVRNVVEVIPSPFHGWFGLIHGRRISELRSASVFVFALFYYQKSLRKRMNYLYYVITKHDINFSGHFAQNR